MSLNWNIEDVKNYKEVAIRHDSYGDNDHLTTEELTQSLITQAVMFRTAAVGIGSITEENAEEFATRSKMYEEMNGTSLYIAGEDYSLTLEDITRRIGLVTNVSKTTDAQFGKMMLRRLRERAKYSVAADKHRAKNEVKEEATA